MNKTFVYLYLILVSLCLIYLATVWIANCIVRKMKTTIKMGKQLDPETGIGNLYYLKESLENSVNDFNKNLYYAVYIMLDVNFIKIYYGEKAISRVLKYVAEVLDNYKNNNEFVARASENGFVYVFQKINKTDAYEKVNKLLGELNNYSENGEKSTRAFLYASVYNLNSADNNYDVILFNLRKNCVNMLGGENQIFVFDGELLSKVREEKTLIESIKHGFLNDEFKLYLQFIVDNKSKKIISAEALSRWDKPGEGVLGPFNYIGIMESTGLIGSLDFYMLDKVCQLLEKWKNGNFSDISVSCNFSRISLSEKNFLDEFCEITNRYDFDKSKLIVEITEDAMEKNHEVAIKNVNELKKKGYEIALDDMGKGHTSLINLCDYPIDVVKIDREILLKYETTKGKSLLKAIISLAHSLDLKTVCEGVETREHVDFISQTDCDNIQGWFYSKVHPIEECEAFVENYMSRNLSIYS